MTAEKMRSQKLIKSINQQKVLYLIYNEGPISRVELAEKTGLTQQTVTNIVNRLLEQEMVLEGTPVVSSGGRKPVPLTVNDSNLFAIGVEVAGKYVRGALYSFRRELTAETERRVSRYESEDHLVGVVRSVIDELLTHMQGATRVKGIGMSIQGLVDSGRGIALRLPGLGWGSYPLRERLEETYGLPVYLENDVNLLAINENMHGSLSGSVNNITLKFDYGIGGAIFAGKELVTGSSFVAGEFGHYKAFTGESAYRCHCGGVGCLTTLASTSGIIRNERLTLDEFVAGVRAEEPRMLELYGRITAAIYLAISNVVTFLNPDHLLLTGNMMNALGDLIMPGLEANVLAQVPLTGRCVKFVHLREAPDEPRLAVGLVVKKEFEVTVERLSL
jgi:transcriptional regulator of PTS gene